MAQVHVPSGTMPDVDDGAGALAALVGGSALLPYGLLKDQISRTIVGTGTSLPGTSSWLTAQLFHVAEGTLLLLVAAGFRAVARRAGTTRRPLGALGYRVAWAGFAMVLGFHAVEHLAAPGTLPAAVAEAVVWGYYVGWLVLLGGQGLVGVDALRADALPRWVPALLVALLPTGVAVGLAVVALGAFTFAGTQRLLLGAAWAAVGYRLRRGRLEPAEVDAPVGG